MRQQRRAGGGGGGAEVGLGVEDVEAATVVVVVTAAVQSWVLRESIGN